MSGALEHLNRAIALSPDYAEAHYNLGVALWYSGSKEKAVAELRESTRQNLAAGESYAFLGTVLEEMGDREAARRSLQRAIALLPPMPSVYVDLGLVLLASGDAPHALGQFEAALNLPAAASPAPAGRKRWNLRQALAKSPDDASAHNVLGRLMGRAGADSKQVAAEFRDAIRLKPDFAEAQNNLGLVLTQSGDDEAAIAAFREAVRLAPSWAEAHDNLGAALTPADVAGAIRELEKALELDPSSAEGAVQSGARLRIEFGTRDRTGNRAVAKGDYRRSGFSTSPSGIGKGSSRKGGSFRSSRSAPNRREA